MLIVEGSWSYGELAEAASKLEVPDDPPRKDRSQYRLVGQPLKRLDGLAKVTGQAQFGIDVKVPGMLYATVRQSPVFGGEVLRYDESTALNVKGVVQVVEILNGVAVVAEKFWQARRALMHCGLSLVEARARDWMIRN